MAVVFQLYRRSDEYRWRLITKSRRLSAFGGHHPTKIAAIRDIEAVRHMLATASIEDVNGDSDREAIDERDPEQDDLVSRVRAMAYPESHGRSTKKAGARVSH